MDIEFSKHSMHQMKLRGINPKKVELVIYNPDSVLEQDDKTKIYSKLLNEEKKKYLYRVFVNQTKTPPLVITVYNPN